MFLGLFFLYNNCIASSAWTESQTWPCVPHPYTVPRQSKYSWSNDTTATRIDTGYINSEGRKEERRIMRMFKIKLLNWQNTDQQIHNTHTQWEGLLNEVRFVNLQIPINQWQFLFESLLMQANILPWIDKPNCTPKIPMTTGLSESPIL